MPLEFRDIYDRWQRSQSFGDPRDLSTFSSDMNDNTGTNDFDAGVKAGWWKKASTSADVNFFEPIAKYSGLEAAGRGVGNLFGGQGGEIGARVARSLPRTLAQTAPLVAAEFIPGAQPLATAGLVGTTGALFGAQTYADTGSPTAAVISGATAAALPGVGRLAGKAVEPFLSESSPYLSKALKFGASQTAQVGTLEGSQAAQSKALGQPFNPLSPEFLAQQVPFSLLDLYHTARAPVVAPKPEIVLPKSKSDYIPPKAEPVAQANLSDMLDRMTGIAKDQTLTPEDQAKAFSDTLGAVMNPDQERAKADNRVILIGHPKQMDNGSIKLLGMASKYYDLPEHKNVFVNNPESATSFVNPDGSMTYITDKKNVSSNVKYPIGPQDIPALRQKGQKTLPQAAPPTGEGIQPETDLLSLRQKFQQTVGNDTIFQAALGKEPKDLEQAIPYWQQAIDKMTPEHLKEGYVSPFDSGEKKVIEEAGVEPGNFIPSMKPIEYDEQGNVIVGLHTYDLQTPISGETSENLNPYSGSGNPAGLRAAARSPEGVVEVTPGQHNIPSHIGSPEGWELGFVDKQGKFLTRNEAQQVSNDARAQQVKTVAQKIESSQAAAADAQEKLDLVPKTAEDVQDLLYHGTQSDVQKFVAGRPVYLTSDIEAAESYAKSSERANEGARVPPREGPSRVLTFRPKFKKVADVEDVEKIVKDIKSRDSVDDILFGTSMDTEKVFGELVKQGYDAIDGFDQNAITGDVIPSTIALKPEELVVDHIKQLTDEGATPTQATEKIRLQGQTPVIDKAKQQVSLSREEIRNLHDQLLELSAKAKGVEAPPTNPKTGKPLTGETEEERALLRAEANKRLKAAGLPVGGVGAQEGFPEKPQAKYGEPVRDENGKNFKTRNLAEAHRDADPDLEGYTVRDAGKKKGFYLAKQINLETSLEGKPGSSLENVVGTEPKDVTTETVDVENLRDQILQEAATTQEVTPASEGAFIPDAEERPEVSFNDYLGQLDLASENPTRLRNAAGFDDLPTAITAIRQFRTALIDVFSKGREGLKDVNEALKKAGVLRFESEEEMLDTFKKMRSGLEEFTDKYRSFALDSQVPHDAELTNEIGVLHPTQGATNFLDWYIRNQKPSLMRDLAEGLRKVSDFSHINLTNDEGRGFWYQPKSAIQDRPQINLNRLPSDREDALGDWGNTVQHELAHDTVADLKTRTDPAAVEFKSTLQHILRVIRTSPLLPTEVRKAIKQAVDEGWGDKGAEEYNKNYDKVLPGRESWKGVHYSLLNEYELVSGVFDSPELVRILQETKMPKTTSTVLNFFSQAWAKMFGYTPNAENAFAKLLTSYDNYLSGTKNAKGYNAISYIRDSLVAAGVKPEGLASRIESVTDTYNKGDLSASIAGYEREASEGLLPATTVAGPLNDDLKTALTTGDAKAVGDATDNLLANELPQHRELWFRMKEDLKIAKNLYDEAQKGNLFAEISLFQEGLKNQFSKLNAMKSALDKQDKALGRWQSLDALGNNEGISRLWSSSLKGNEVPEPTDQSGNEDIARQAMGLEAPSAEFISNRRRELAETGARPNSWIDKMFKFASFTSEEMPGFKPIYSTAHETQSDAYRRMTELSMVKNSGATKGWDKAIAKANKRVYETPGLDRIASDILRRAQILDKMHETFSFDDPEVQEALKRASTEKGRSGRSDRDDVVTAVNSEFSRAQHYINSVVPEHLTRMNRILTAGGIIGREIGMPFTKAWDLAGQMYTALGKLRDPAQAPIGAEELRAVASQMQPETFMKVLQQGQGFITDSEKHLAVLQKYSHYVSEQRYGNFHLVMSREGEPLRESYNTEKAARSRAKELQSDGWTLEDIIPKNRTNVANTWGHDPVVSSMQELDQQALNRFESLIVDLPVDKREQLRPLVERAADYQASNAAFTPIPTQASPRRRFVPGRETIDMIDNAEQYYRRSINWMRHRETRAQTAFQMLDPEILGNRPLREYAQTFVDNQLAPDNPVARRLAEATFYWNLAGNFGVDFLHSIQSLTTGMASVISETGSTADALKYVTGASKKVFQRYTTGKWGDKNSEFFVNWLTARGGLGLPAWGDIFDPSTMNYFQTNGPESTYGKTLNAIKNGVRGYKGIFLRHNDMVGGLAGFQLGLDRGMSVEDAARFGEGVKDRGFYSGGKVQRPVGLWNMQTKAVPQLLSALRTYTLGWFSQLSHNYKVGFGNAPGEFSVAQRQGAKQAFAYMLGAQAVLAGALGLPGVGQGLGLLKQTTGLDLKGWTRKNLAAMFGEDQDDYGGLLTGMAMHGLVSQFAPFDPSGRHIPNFPFIGVTPSKGFDINNLIPAPFTTAADIIGGLGAAAKGQDPMRALPTFARGPINLLQGGGDIRNSRGELLYQLSPIERIVKALGLEPSRVAAAKETAATVSDMNKAAAANKDNQIDQVATLYRRGDTVNAQKRLAEIQKENPTYDMASFVRAVSGAVEKQTIPYDWKRAVNPALDIVGLSSNQPSQELNRLQLRRGVESDLGLYNRPSLHSDIRAASIDDLMNSDPYATRSAALQRLLTARQLRSRNISLTPLEFQ